MLRAGQCSSCNRLFDPDKRTTMLSVVCGHSLCNHYVTQPIASAPVSDADSTMSEDSTGDDNIIAWTVYDKHLAEFATNFNASSNFQSSNSILGQLLHRRRRSNTHFTVSPVASKRSHPALVEKCVTVIIHERVCKAANGVRSPIYLKTANLKLLQPFSHNF